MIRAAQIRSQPPNRLRTCLIGILIFVWLRVPSVLKLELCGLGALVELTALDPREIKRIGLA